MAMTLLVVVVEGGGVVVEICELRGTLVWIPAVEVVALADVDVEADSLIVKGREMIVEELERGVDCARLVLVAGTLDAGSVLLGIEKPVVVPRLSELPVRIMDEVLS